LSETADANVGGIRVALSS